MKKNHANGCQDYYINQNIEKIVKNTAHMKVISIGILFEFILILIGIAIEQSIYVTEFFKRIYICVLICVLITIVLYIFLLKLVNYIKNKSMRVKNRIRRHVNSFDDEICCYVMKCKYFQEFFSGCNDKEDINKKIFYYTEICYYRNKAICELYKMIQVLTLVFEINPGKIRTQKKVSIFRLENIIKLINEITDFINSHEEIISSYYYKNVLIEENNNRSDNFEQLKSMIKEVFYI